MPVLLLAIENLIEMVQHGASNDLQSLVISALKIYFVYFKSDESVSMSSTPFKFSSSCLPCLLGAEIAVSNQNISQEKKINAIFFFDFLRGGET